MARTAILFTGLICPEMLDLLIAQTQNIQFKYASIWENENPEYILQLTENNFVVIKNNIKEMELYTPQFIPIVNGLKYIKDQEFDYVLKTRFDIASFNFLKYIEIIQNLYPEKITVIAGIQTDITYFIDIIVFGKISEMCSFYKLQEINDKQCPEIFLIKNYLGKVNSRKEDLKNIFNFSLTKCIENNIEFIWSRSNKWKTPSRTIPYMRVIKEYCTESDIWI
jgi:hypothetical protein